MICQVLPPAKTKLKNKTASIEIYGAIRLKLLCMMWIVISTELEKVPKMTIEIIRRAGKPHYEEHLQLVGY